MLWDALDEDFHVGNLVAGVPDTLEAGRVSA